jgi:hypothetical protein
MWVKKYFEEFETGDTRRTTGRTITETDIVIHAGQTGDFFPHHMDEEWCRTQPFGKRIAHGTLVFSIAIGLTADHVNEVSMTYGYERLRFTRPVFIGDTLELPIIAINTVVINGHWPSMLPSRSPVTARTFCNRREEGCRRPGKRCWHFAPGQEIRPRGLPPPRMTQP